MVLFLTDAVSHPGLYCYKEKKDINLRKTKKEFWELQILNALLDSPTHRTTVPRILWKKKIMIKLVSVCGIHMQDNMGQFQKRRDSCMSGKGNFSVIFPLFLYPEN